MPFLLTNQGNLHNFLKRYILIIFSLPQLRGLAFDMWLAGQVDSFKKESKNFI